jgi:hypothetical protein
VTQRGDDMKRYLKNLPGVNALARRLKAGMKKWDHRKFHRQLSTVQQTHDLAVVIIMPGSVHIGALALNYLRGNKQVLCISNGLAKWEYEILLGCPFTAVAKTSRTLAHSEVIDELIEVLDKPFWLVDHDCYVLDVKALHEERQKLGTCAGLAFFSFPSLISGTLVPETFLLLLNTGIIRRLQKKYGITCRSYLWTELPENVKARLEVVGVGHNRLPEDHKQYFDILRVVALLAQADGCGFIMEHRYNSLCQPYPEAIHIGGTSWPKWPLQDSDWYAGIGTYFWRRCLEKCRLDRIQNEYSKRWPQIPDSQTIWQHLFASGVLRQYHAVRQYRATLGILRQLPVFVNSDFSMSGDSRELREYFDNLIDLSLPKKSLAEGTLSKTHIGS